MKSKEEMQKVIRTIGDTAYRFNLLIDDFERFYEDGNIKCGRNLNRTLDKIINTLTVIKREISYETHFHTKSHIYLYHVSGNGEESISTNVKIKDLAYLNDDLLIITPELKEMVVIIDTLCDANKLNFIITGGYMPLYKLSPHINGRAVDIVVNTDFDWFIGIVKKELENKNFKGIIRNCGGYIHFECFKIGTKSLALYIKEPIKSQHVNCSNRKTGLEVITQKASSLIVIATR
ncbi:hypothetical protein LCGC14_0342020 [marine sediment metagenome]|uniref:Uncharacterized protein n=1 Tax=marine sediment metagenome TaxID=412755 RepID=A0A0F9TD37_9ZZZZ